MQHIHPSPNSLKGKESDFTNLFYYLKTNNLNESITQGIELTNQSQLYLQLSQCTNQDKFIHTQTSVDFY